MSRNPIKTITNSKKSLLITGAFLTFAAAGIAGILSLPKSSSADTPSPIVQQVNHNTDELSNHEARIKNAENNIQDLQNKTNTPASSSNIDVPAVTAPPAPAPITDSPPAPITVITSEYVSPAGNCLLTYSDNTRATVKAIVTTQDGSMSADCQGFVGQTK